MALCTGYHDVLCKMLRLSRYENIIKNFELEPRRRRDLSNAFVCHTRYNEGKDAKIYLPTCCYCSQTLCALFPCYHLTQIFPSSSEYSRYPKSQPPGEILSYLPPSIQPPSSLFMKRTRWRMKTSKTASFRIDPGRESLSSLKIKQALLLSFCYDHIETRSVDLFPRPAFSVRKEALTLAAGTRRGHEAHDGRSVDRFVDHWVVHFQRAVLVVFTL